MTSTNPSKSNSTGFQEERAELAVLLASPELARSGNLCKILRYICEQCFEGESATLKEYTIAVGALGRSPDFNPDKDSIVRVEASRLRKRLRQYYDAEGVDHAVHILLPESGYVPQFISRPVAERPQFTPPPEPPSVAPIIPPASPRPYRKRGMAIAGAVFLAAAILATVLVLTTSRSRLSEAREPGPPSETISGASGALVQSEEIRIIAGLTGPKYIDSMGRTWLADRWFTGGRTFAEHDRRVLRTLDQGIYQTARMGDFQYRIPLKPGVYELRLHFAEMQYGGTTSLESGMEGVRRFHISLNGKPLLTDFDIIASTGASATADERVYRDVEPARDGFLQLDFSSYHGAAQVNAIEILPGTPGKMRPVRILAGSHVYVDEHEQLWNADRYFLGGRVSRLTAPVEADDPGLYVNARWGHFTYAIPVAEGRYTVKLRFAEPTYGFKSSDGRGKRIFDVYCNGIALLRDFDIFKEAGANRGITKTFRGLEPNGQGKLHFWFLPAKDYANIFAIEVTPE